MIIRSKSPALDFFYATSTYRVENARSVLSLSRAVYVEEPDVELTAIVVGDRPAVLEGQCHRC